MNVIATPAPAPDYAAIKTKQNAAWASGDYARIGSTLQITGESLAEAMDLAPDSTVLDVAAGNGNASLAFARRWCRVTATDYVDALLARGRMRAEADGLDLTWEMADAERLPYAQARFDAVVSTFGVMFAPDQRTAAREMLRVCRPGGRIGMANWTPDSFIGQVFRTLGKHLPPPAGLSSPAQWGDRAWLQAAFGAEARQITVNDRVFNFRYRSPQHFVAFFREWYGPVHKAFLALDEAGRAALEADLVALIGRMNSATDGSMKVGSAYAEVIIDRR